MNGGKGVGDSAAVLFKKVSTASTPSGGGMAGVAPAKTPEVGGNQAARWAQAVAWRGGACKSVLGLGRGTVWRSSCS